MTKKKPVLNASLGGGARTRLCVVAVMMLGCAGANGEEDEDAGPAIATTTEAFTSVTRSTFFAGPGPETSYVSLGPTAGQTCFLTGVSGHLHNSAAGVRSDRITGGVQYFDLVIVLNAPGQWLLAQAACVSSVLNRTPEVAGPNPITHRTFVAAGTQNRRCFLTNVHAGTLDSQGDSVRVGRDAVDGNWYLTGTAGVSARARCIDVTTNLMSLTLSGGNVDATRTLVADSPGTACLLTHIGGAFTNSHIFGGSRLYPFDGMWHALASAGKSVGVNCVN